MAKGKKQKRFWKIYGVCMGILLGIVGILVIKVWKIMEEYEAAQPERVIEEIVEQIASGDTAMVSMETSSRFEDVSAVLQAEFTQKVSGAELTYGLDSSSYDVTNPVYDLAVGEEVVACVTLRAVNAQRKMAILTVYDWEIESITGVFEAGPVFVNITAPENYTVTVNGIALTEKDRTGEAQTMDGFEYVAAYVTAPATVQYAIAGLYETPKIVATDPSGREFTAPETDLSDVVFSYEPQEISDELAETVIDNAKTYSNFFSRDLPGCTTSTDPVAFLFPEDSYYLDMLETYRKDDMWTFSGHETPVFSGEEAVNYTVYFEDCFSVEVLFDKSMRLKNGVTRVDHNDQIWYYVKVNGSFVVADIKEATTIE